MARGIERRKLFLDDKDRESFLDRLAVILEEIQTQCYAWALIPNHFHLLLRTGPTPLSKVMRRLMTGYAVTFNKRHKRSGHLFQNRYKSIICEEDPYLLELIRYVHLNPLRAELVQDLNELDNYPWAGHIAILGHCKNPLIPEVSKQDASPSRPKGLVCSDSDLPRSIHVSGSAALFNRGPSSRIRTNQQTSPLASLAPLRFNDKSLAEKTIEDVLLHFGETQKVARRRYRDFVEKGVDQGRRPEFQGGGLVRSAGGEKAGLLGRKGEEREKGDARILGSGDFVSTILSDSADTDLKNRGRISLDLLGKKVASQLEVEDADLKSSNKKRSVVDAKAVFGYLAIKKMGYSGREVGTFLNMRSYSAIRRAQEGKIVIDKRQLMWDSFLE